MNCLEFRRAVGADPNHRSPESLAHRADCPACEKYAQEMLRLNGLIKRALEMPVRTDKIARNAARMSWYAIAASVLLVVGFGSMLWLFVYPQASLAADVVDHMVHEPESLTVTQARISAELLDGVLRAKGMHLAKPMSEVSYLETCQFRKDLIPHIVVQTDRGPVTVLLLAEEKVARIRQFDEQHYHGVLVPMERGAMAVMASDASVVNSVAEKVKASIAWN